MTNFERYGEIPIEPGSGRCPIVDLDLWRSRKQAQSYLAQFELPPEQAFRLRLIYDQAQTDMESFFASGHPRPDHGDNSY